MKMKDDINIIETPELPENNQVNHPKFKLRKNKILHNTLKKITIKKTPVAGYGKCSSCGCKGYVSKHNNSHECKNCEHHFSRHWD